jgi:hypothetical protein
VPATTGTVAFDGCIEIRWVGLALRRAAIKHGYGFLDEKVEQHNLVPVTLEPGKEQLCPTVVFP